jgi:hypothetical protein
VLELEQLEGGALHGREPPPSRNEPAEETASMTFFGPTVQVTRQPG